MNTTFYENHKSINRILNNSLYFTILLSVICVPHLVLNNPLAATGKEIAKTAFLPPTSFSAEPLVISQPISLAEEKQRWETRLRMRYKGVNIVQVSEGVKHIQLVRYINSRPVKINIVEVNRKLNPNIEIAPQLASENLNRRATIRTIAQKNNSIAAVNGTYFKPQTGVPLGTLMIDKKVYTGPIYNRVAMGIGKNEFKMSKVGIDSYLKTKGAPPVTVDNINQPRMLSTYVLIYTKDWGQNSPTPPQYGTNIAIGAKGEVITNSSGSVQIPEQGYVISGPIEKLKPFFNASKVELDIKMNPVWNNVDHIISGGPYLVKEGEIYIDVTEQKLAAITGKNPRTAIGYTAENDFIMVTVDGREQNSVGMTLGELARMMKDFGCVNAMNLDGGGSSVMYVNGRVVNSPAQAGGIPISNALTISEKSHIAAADTKNNKN